MGRLLSTPVDNSGDKLWGKPAMRVDTKGKVVHNLWAASLTSSAAEAVTCKNVPDPLWKKKMSSQPDRFAGWVR